MASLSHNQSNLTQTIFVCTFCAATFTKSCNLSRHVKRKHDICIQKKKGKKCPMCQVSESTYKDLEKHLSIYHDIMIEYENLNFDNKNDFNQWKLEVESSSKSFFTLLKTQKNGTLQMTQYGCHRSGYYNPHTKIGIRQRALKVKGTNKISACCPARIDVLINATDCKVNVQYVKTHVGHETEVGRLHLPNCEREEIAAKLLRGIPNQRILKDISSDFNPDRRLSYTTNRDIHNIKKAFNVQSDVIFHNDDATSVDILIKKFQSSQENPILQYKPYGVDDEDLGKENFFLAFMNSGQQDMLEKYGDNILMIDSTHGTNPYKIHLSTLMVVDFDYEGFPVAFLWSKTQTEKMFQTFFYLIKQRYSNLDPKVFLSDDSPVFYNAFQKVYDKHPNKIICDWHIKKNLFENLSKISDLEKRKLIKKQLKCIINELDEETFQQNLELFLNSLFSDPITEKYGQYFATYYAKRSTQWAHCYRKNFKKNTNMSLEKWHQELKHNSTSKGKRFQRMDLSINNVIECLRGKFFKRLISNCRSRIPRKLAELRKRHNIAMQLLEEVQVFPDIPGKKWLVGSSKNKLATSLLEFYNVELNSETFNNNCMCNFMCQECKNCIHSFSCTCHDYLVQFNMCKHIHLVNQKYLSELSKVYPGHELEENLICDDNNNNSNKSEVDLVCKQLKEYNSTAQDLEKSKELFKNKIQELVLQVDNCNSIEVMEHTNKNLITLLSSVRALSVPKSVNILSSSTEKMPPNKNTVHQLRAFEKRKRNKKRNKFEDAEIADLNSLQFSLTADINNL